MKGKHYWWHDLIVGFIFAVTTILMTWPLILRINSHFAGVDPDVWINPWATWWTAKAISEGRSLFSTDLMFYPHGVSLVFHSFSHLNSAFALLLQPWLGRLGAYNVTILLTHVLSGFGMFSLARYITHDVMGAFFAGLVFAFFPYRMDESVHPVIVSTQWIPIFFLFLIRMLKEERKRYAVLAAIFFILTALSSWHLMLFAVLLSAIYLGYSLVFERKYWSRTTVRNLVLLTGITLIALAPLLYPLVREQLTTTRSYVGVDLEEGMGNDLLAFLLPPVEHPILGRLAEPLHSRIRSWWSEYLGFTVLALSVVGSLADRRRAGFWVVLALLSMLFSLGPYLQINGNALNVLVPWSVPIVWLFRHPFRFGVLLGFALAVTSGLGLSAILSWLTDRRVEWRWPFAGTMVLLLLFEYLVIPFPTTEAAVPDFYSDLSTQPGESPILELPMGRQPAKVYLYYQITHGRPLVEGVVSRTPIEAYAFIEETPALRALKACINRVLPPVDLSSVLNALAENDIEYVILHKDLVTPASLDTWLSIQSLPSDYEDEQIVVFGTLHSGLPATGQPQLLEACIIGKPTSSDRISAIQGQTLDIALEWTAGSSPGEELNLELALTNARGELAQNHLYIVVPGIPVTAWAKGSKHQVTYPFPVDSSLPPGSYRLHATLVGAGMEREAFLSAPLLDVNVSASSNGSRLPLMQHVVKGTFGPALRLLGYDLDVKSDAIYLVLHWQALQPMETDYKFFTHLYEMKDDLIVAQKDVMPYNWTYPTTWWQVGEVVSDKVTIPLEGVSPGIYRLATGVYDPTTGIRVAVRNAEGQLQPLDRLVLKDVVKK